MAVVRTGSVWWWYVQVVFGVGTYRLCLVAVRTCYVRWSYVQVVCGGGGMHR